MHTTKFLILNSSLKFILNQNEELNSINEVIKGLGYTKGAFFHYFKSKEDFYCQLCTQLLTSALKEYDNLLRRGRKGLLDVLDDIEGRLKPKSHSDFSKIFYAYRIRLDCPVSKGVCRSIEEFEIAFQRISMEYLDIQKSRGGIPKGFNSEGFVSTLLFIIRGLLASSSEGLDTRLTSSFSFLKSTLKDH